MVRNLWKYNIGLTCDSEANYIENMHCIASVSESIINNPLASCVKMTRTIGR